MYNSETEGRDDFIEKFEIKNIERQSFNDGIFNGNIFEFKLVVNDINATLFQTIKYLSRMRVQGKLIPKNILLVSLNDEKVYKFDSGNFIERISKVYYISASKNNEGFKTDILPVELKYDDLTKTLEENNFTRVPVDIYNVINLAKLYYDLDYTKTKGDFFNELRNPTEHYLKNYILPWTGQENDFRFIMDTLNAKQNKRELGAFYTPLQYVKLMTDKLLKPTIKRAEALIETGEFTDYIILDRCAGTGNLEEFLTDEELSHCILNTYELQEWFVLNSKFNGKIRQVLPENPDLNSPLLKEGDTLSIEILPEIKRYIEDPKCLIIMLENPPYSDNGYKIEGEQIEGNKGKIFSLMKEELSGASLNELANQFIWSAFNIYMKKTEDCYILFSPIKYWKSIKLAERKFINGFLFNRKHFHATPSAISCVEWKNEKESVESISLKAVDIIDGNLVEIKDVEIKKAHNILSELYDRGNFPSDTEDGVYLSSSGYLSDSEYSLSGKKYNENIVGYLQASAFAVDPKNVWLGTSGYYKGHGFYLRDDKFVEKLPLFCAKLFPQKEWYERDIYFTTSDKGNEYEKDKIFLKNCFIFTCLSQKNHCISFVGSDDRLYKNKLCFDENTLASNKLKEFELTEMDEEILKDWNKVLHEAKLYAHNENFSYGLYQIEKEINAFFKDEKGKKHYEHVNLNSLINILKDSLKKYYEKKVLPGLFEYELLK
jgi:hypothetical protein